MKTYNGYELIKALKNREIPKGTKIYIRKSIINIDFTQLLANIDNYIYGEKKKKKIFY